MNQTTTDAVPVRPAASAVILRDCPEGIEVFMVVRHHEIDFASGALVFPGGKVDADEANIETQEAVAIGAGPAPSFWMAAIRETFEEAGLLLARRQGEAKLLAAEDTQALVKTYRPALLAGTLTFAHLLKRENLRPALDLMVHFAHWITPPGPPRRFDTHFFLVAAPVAQTGVHDGLETTEGVWIAPRRAIEDADAGRRIMLPPTRLNLHKLAQFSSVHAAAESTRSSTVVTVLPRIERVEGGRRLLLPLEAGYGMSELFIPAR